MPRAREHESEEGVWGGQSAGVEARASAVWGVGEVGRGVDGARCIFVGGRSFNVRVERVRSLQRTG